MKDEFCQFANIVTMRLRYELYEIIPDNTKKNYVKAYHAQFMVSVLDSENEHLSVYESFLVWKAFVEISYCNFRLVFSLLVKINVSFE